MSSSNSGLARNAIFLYCRSIISLLISLISVRFLLKYLGVDDYGLYGLIGSIVGIVETLKGLLSSSLQRFINISRGTNNHDSILDIFNVGLRLHIGFALFLIFASLIAGVIFIPILNIPENQLIQTYIVLICSSATMGLGIITVPYDSLIIAFERFKAYAYFSILYSILKLICVIILIFFDSWRLSLYSVFLLIAAVIMRLVSLIYCKKEFYNYTRVNRVADKTLYQQIGKFAGWKSLGTISATLQASGINFALNIFGGLAVNTARTITYQVMNAVNILIWNINTAFSPRCITAFSSGDKVSFYAMMYLMSKITFLLNAFLGLGIILFIPSILLIWLGEIPLYTISFIRLIFFYSIMKSLQDSIDVLYTAVGKLKFYQTITFICCILSVAISYLFLSLNTEFYIVFIIMGIAETIIVTCSLIYAKIYLEFNLKDYWNKILSKISISLLILIGICIFNYKIEQSELQGFTLMIISGTLWLFGGLSTCLIMLNKHEYQQLLTIIKKKR